MMVHCRPVYCLIVFAALSMASGCTRAPVELKMVTPRLPIDERIAEELASLLNEHSAVNVTLVPSPDTQKTARDALLSGAADLALVYNNETYHADISTVVPLYPTVLHIAYLKSLQLPSDQDGSTRFAAERQLLANHKVWAGPPGSVSRRLFEQASSRFGIEKEAIEFTDGNTCAEVIIVFAPIRTDNTDLLRSCGEYQLHSLGLLEELGTGSRIESVSLLNPKVRPFIIPEDTYDEITPSAVLTLAVDKLLVASTDLPDTVVYDLLQEVLQIQPALSHLHPTLFSSLNDEFELTRSTFRVHPGALAFLDRDAPSIYERYSGIAEVVVTLMIGLLSGGFALLRIYQIKRKNRIDVFYADAMSIRDSALASTDIAVRQKAVADVRELQNRAFEMLVNEKLAADESFRIFITLSNDVMQDLSSTESVRPGDG